MANLKNTVAAVVLISVVLMDFAAEARRCRPACAHDERCIAWRPRGRRSRRGVCVPSRCLFRPRRGRCRSFRHPYHFNRATMSCVRDSRGACYGRRNRFTTMEDCELVCLPWH